MKIGFVYAGQGSQYVGMGKDLYETYPVFQQALDELDTIVPVKAIAFDGPEEALKQTENTQPAMVAFAIAMTELLQSEGIQPEIVAGLSLGEYSALYAAGVFTKEDVMQLIAYRGKVMAEASQHVETSMVAVLGMTLQEVKTVLDTIDSGVVEISNSNTIGQVVIGGETKAVDIAVELLKENGAKRCIPLKVSGPFHTSFMNEPEIKLREKFVEIPFETPNMPVVHNVTGMIQQEDEKLQDLLATQVNHTVLFEQSIQTLLDNGVDTFIEIGPGKVLGGFIKKMNRDAAIYAVDSVESLAVLLETLKDIGRSE